MSSSKDMEEYYQKVIHLQEKLRRSEEERLQLEMKYNEMIETIKEEEEAHLKKIRSKYKQFLEEDRRRQQRNDKILDALERIENRSMMWEAKTKKFKTFRNRFQHYLKPDDDHQVENNGDVINKYLQTVSSKPEDRYSKLGNINSIYCSKTARDIEKNNEQNYDSSKTSKDFQNSLKQSIKPVATQLEKDTSTHDELKRLLVEEDSTQFREKKNLIDSDEEVGDEVKMKKNDGIQNHASLRSKHEKIDLHNPEEKGVNSHNDGGCEEERFVDEVALITSSYVVPAEESHDQDGKELKSITDHSVPIQDGSNKDPNDANDPVLVGGLPEFPRCGSLLSVSPSQASEDQLKHSEVAENLLHLSEVPVYRSEAPENTFAILATEKTEVVDEQGGEGCDASGSVAFSNETNEESQESFIQQPCDPNPQTCYPCDATPQQCDPNLQTCYPSDATPQPCDPNPQDCYPCDATPQPCDIQYDCNGVPIDEYNCEAYMQYNQQNSYYAEDYSAQPSDYSQYDATAQPYDENGQPYQYYDNTMQYDENGEVITQACEENLQYEENVPYEDYGQFEQQYAENEPTVHYAENEECLETDKQPALTTSPKKHKKGKKSPEPPREEDQDNREEYPNYETVQYQESEQYGVNEYCLESDSAQPTSVTSPKKNKRKKTRDSEPSREDDELKKSQIPANASTIVENIGNECGCNDNEDMGYDESEYYNIQYYCNCGSAQCNCDAYMQNFYYTDYSQYETAPPYDKNGQSCQYYYDQYSTQNVDYEDYGQYQQYEEYKPICESCHQYERNEFDQTRVRHYSAPPTMEKKNDVVALQSQGDNMPMSESCEYIDQPPSERTLRMETDTARSRSTKNDNKKNKQLGKKSPPCDNEQDERLPISESCECSENVESDKSQPPSATNLKNESGNRHGTSTKKDKNKKKSGKKSPPCDDEQENSISYEHLPTSESCDCRDNVESDQSQPRSATNLKKESDRQQATTTKIETKSENKTPPQDEHLPISESCECSENLESGESQPSSATNLKKESNSPPATSKKKKKKPGKKSPPRDEEQDELLQISESCECSENVESEQSQAPSATNLKKESDSSQTTSTKKKKKTGKKSLPRDDEQDEHLPISESCECSENLESGESQPPSATNLKKEPNSPPATSTKKKKKSGKKSPPRDEEQDELLPISESCECSENVESEQSQAPSAANLNKESDISRSSSTKKKKKSGKKSPPRGDEQDERLPISVSCECSENSDQSKSPSATNLKQKSNTPRLTTSTKKDNKKEKKSGNKSPPISESCECAHSHKQPQPTAVTNGKKKSKEASCEEVTSEPICPKTEQRRKNKEFHQKCLELTESDSFQLTNTKKYRKETQNTELKDQKDKKLDQDCLEFVVPKNSQPNLVNSPKENKKEKKQSRKTSPPCDDDINVSNKRLPISESCLCVKDHSHKPPPQLVTNAKKEKKKSKEDEIISKPICSRPEQRRKNEEFHEKCLELTESHSFQLSNPKNDRKDKIHTIEIKERKNKDGLQIVVPKTSTAIPEKDTKEKKKWKWGNRKSKDSTPSREDEPKK